MRRRRRDNPGLAGMSGVHDRDAFGRTAEERDSHALPVLFAAFHRLCRGWMSCEGLARLEQRGQPRPEGACALWEALAAGSHDRTLIDVEYARRLVRRVVWGFNDWESDPRRTRDEVLQLLRKAIVLGGGEPPSIPLAPIRSRHHGGGWRITSGARRAG